MEDEWADYGKPVEVAGHKGREIRRGTLYRTLRDHLGAPVYEVDFGAVVVGGRESGTHTRRDIRRLRGDDTLRFLD